MRYGRRRWLDPGLKRGGSPGQASVELVAILPALVACVVIAAQVLPAGWALWSAANAARAGARAEHVGGDAEQVARRALPGELRRGARVRASADVGEEQLRVTVRAPALLPGLERPAFAAATRLGPGGAP